MESMETTHTTCTGFTYDVNPYAPEEGTDVHHDGPCPAHPSTLTDADVEAIELHHSTAGLQPTIPSHSRAADPTATRFRRLHDLLAEIEMLYGLAPREAIVEVRDMAELGLLDGER